MKTDDERLSQHTVISGIGPNDSSFESTSNPPGSQESFSIFGDTACGEPLCAQKLNLDFTPIEEIDNDYVQRKCCAFWNYLNSRTDLHHLMVVPEKKLYDPSRISEIEHTSPQRQDSSPKPTLERKETTAVSMLEFVEDKGLIDRTFEAKLPQSMCSLGSREYRENEKSAKSKPSSQRKEAMCQCKGICKSCKNRKAAGPQPDADPDVQLMCTRMRDWDRAHPKSMEPPGHPPALSRCVMQRKLNT